eukprot:CAMPEP_0172820856 /NCGR_PEP_ID=MMETSP1075-20121228/15544_1 /TAXON_ID=2916 /ORGANISM="Ceratium fusus, Strain PA161109" /LENGTH=75 /DNA_ID=CAMNT_0013661585 /DNA_START=247 /DNA_END=474 /DNA_ORIENTATION=+
MGFNLHQNLCCVEVVDLGGILGLPVELIKACPIPWINGNISFPVVPTLFFMVGSESGGNIHHGGTAGGGLWQAEA